METKKQSLLNLEANLLVFNFRHRFYFILPRQFTCVMPKRQTRPVGHNL
jgi:hypothetical protein